MKNKIHSMSLESAKTVSWFNVVNLDGTVCFETKFFHAKLDHHNCSNLAVIRVKEVRLSDSQQAICVLCGFELSEDGIRISK